MIKTIVMLCVFVFIMRIILCWIETERGACGVHIELRAELRRARASRACVCTRSHQTKRVDI